MLPGAVRRAILRLVGGVQQAWQVPKRRILGAIAKAAGKWTENVEVPKTLERTIRKRVVFFLDDIRHICRYFFRQPLY